MAPSDVGSGNQRLQKFDLRAPGRHHDSSAAPRRNGFTYQTRGFIRRGLRHPNFVVEFAQDQRKPSGARGRKNLHMNAVDIQEIEARSDITLNDLSAGRFQTFRERGAVERGGEAIVIDANFVAWFG